MNTSTKVAAVPSVQPQELIPLEAISSHPSMREPLELARKAALSQSDIPAPILITGESGTGKDILASAIHHASPRQENPYITFNCSGVPETLFESELFGYAKGAFTGAHNGGKEGLIHAANEGTLFLDEIGEMPLAAQAKLLHFLQNRHIRRLGETQLETVDVRVIAATNKDLITAVGNKEFRLDLFYRLRVMEILLPPLRNRPEDILILSENFLANWAKREKKTIRSFTEAAHKALARHTWPGNIRELENVIRRAVIIADNGQHIGMQHLPSFAGRECLSTQNGSQELRSLEAVKQEHVARVLRHTHGNVSQASRILGVARASLYKLANIRPS